MIFLVVALVLLTIGAFFFFVRLLKGPSLASRVIALDGISFSVAGRMPPEAPPGR